MSYREWFNSNYIKGAEGHWHKVCPDHSCGRVWCNNQPCEQNEYVRDWQGFDWWECLTEYINRRRTKCKFCRAIYYLRFDKIEEELIDNHKCDKDHIIWRAELRIRKLWRRVVNHMLVSEAEVLTDMILNSDGTELLAILEDAKKVAARLKVLLQEHRETENKVNG